MRDRHEALREALAKLAAKWTIPDAAAIHTQEMHRKDFEDSRRRQREAQERAGDA